MPATDEDRSKLLDRMQYRADPLADRIIARILGDLPEGQHLDGAQALEAAFGPTLARIELVTRLIGQWRNNGQLAHWQPDLAAAPDALSPQEIAAVVAALQDYLRQASALPSWADPARIARAETLFFDDGPLSVLQLFCASLPQCYVVPDLAEVLHVSGQLERHTDYRIRATGAMIFPVMMRGGMTQPQGFGVAQVLKVRLIHATIRHLILRGEPERLVAELGGLQGALDAGVVPPLHGLGSDAPGPLQMHRALLAHGWRLGADGLPVNQEEMGYTLLTFGYVALQGMRTLGLAYGRSDEEDMLHAWNVMGHFVGVSPELMAHTTADAQAWFDLMQARGRQRIPQPDPRPHLGQSLVAEMARLVPWALIKPVPQLLVQRLCGPATSRDIGIDTPVPWTARWIFGLGLALFRAIDSVLMTLFGRRASLVRLVTRRFGYRAISHFLLSQTRPLKLPEHLLNRVNEQVTQWRQA